MKNIFVDDGLIEKCMGSVPLLPLSEYEKKRLAYRELTQEEYNTEILHAIKRIEQDNKVVGTPERTIVWEDGWKENLDKLKETHSLDALYPLYFRKDQPFRLFQRFVYTDNHLFDLEVRAVLIRNLIKKYAENCSNCYEFGCGTGVNLAEISKWFPDMKLYGCDLTESSGKILDILREEHNIDVRGHQFDYTKPDADYHIKEDSVVCTMASLEQIGNRWEPFLRYLLKENPKIVIHLEPIEEFYDDEILLDYLAKTFHGKRNYLSGYYTELKKLENDGKIEILQAHRSYIGNLNDESYSIVVWKEKS